MSTEKSDAGPLMKAEILAQPDAWRQVAHTVDEFLGRKSLPRALRPSFLKRVSHAVVFGSGSSYHAALLARDYLSILAGIPSRAAHASEVFHWEEPRPDRVLAIALSHSGGSIDVRAAVRRARRQGIASVAITNVEDSPLAREAEAVLVT
ncbi:MAG TPA: SIS domain-containing protein, partial [Vicinamibacteria bacterium]